LEALKAEPPAKARIMPLSVAGAFHTEYMISAREELAGLIGGLNPADPSRLLLSNADGHAVTSGGEAVSRLVSCLRPARWPAWPSGSGREQASRSWRSPRPPTSTAPGS
jgi:hypothetical protein